MLFSFDPDKNIINLEKHGISLADAWLVFFADHKLTLDSNRNGEKKMAGLGVGRNGRHSAGFGLHDSASRRGEGDFLAPCLQTGKEKV